MLITTIIAAFTAATISAGVTLYAYSRGKRAGHAQGFAQGLEAARPAFGSPFGSSMDIFAMLALLEKLTKKPEPTSTPETPTAPA